jgi:hypothetical protein
LKGEIYWSAGSCLIPQLSFAIRSVLSLVAGGSGKHTSPALTEFSPFDPVYQLMMSGILMFAFVLQMGFRNSRNHTNYVTFPVCGSEASAQKDVIE